MKLAALIGSYARGDYDARSDCDVVLVGTGVDELDPRLLPCGTNVTVSFVEYEEDIFVHLHSIGSLFIFHILSEGVCLVGSEEEWGSLRREFIVQRDFRRELAEIAGTTNLLADTEIFGQKYLTPMVNVFTELKNACIFYLAHHGVYEFNKGRCFDRALGHVGAKDELKALKAFYDYSVRGLDVSLPFDLGDTRTAVRLLEEANAVARGMLHACRT